jgi:D-tyrosyl-tRNA(Tyr) deacylase
MRAVIQRVSRAEVRVDGEATGRIGRGLVVFLGIAKGDLATDAEFIEDRVAGLRVLADEAGKMNLAIGAAGGELMVISQFTLLADTSQRRPSFTEAAGPTEARELYEYFLSLARRRGVTVQMGQFGAHMDVELLNDGPVTIILDSRNR